MKLLEGPGLIILLFIVLLIFGPTKLPQLGKSLGKTMKAIRDGADGKAEELDEAEEPAAKAEEKKPEAQPTTKEAHE